MRPTNRSGTELAAGRSEEQMLNRLSKLFMAAGAAATVATGAMIPRPASADTTSTILTAAAAIGAIVLYSNYQHKQAQANQVVGYTRNGGTVYGDGRVVMPNGQTYYPNANGQYTYNTGTYNGGYNNGQYNGGYYPNGTYNTGTYNNGYYNGQYNHPTNNGRWNNNGQYATANNGRWNDQNAKRHDDRDDHTRNH
jgi:hypothetical protein